MRPEHAFSFKDGFHQASLSGLKSIRMFPEPELNLLKEYFDEEQINTDAAAFDTILKCFSPAPRFVLNACSKGEHGWTPDFAASLAERYGDFAPLLVSNLRIGTPQHVSKHGVFFDHLADDGSYAAQRLTSSLGSTMLDGLSKKSLERMQSLPLDSLADVLLQFKTRGFFQSNPGTILTLIERYGSFANSFVSRASRHGMNSVLRYERKHRTFLESLGDNKELQDCFGSFMEEVSLTNRSLPKYHQQILDLSKRYGPAANRWYQLAKTSVFKQTPEFYELLERVQDTLESHDVGHASGATFAALPANAVEYEDCIQTVIKSCKEYAANVLEHVNEDLLTKHADTIAHLTTRCGAYSYPVMRAYAYKIPDRVKKDTDFVHHMLDHCPITVAKVFTNADYYAFKNNREGMMDAATRYGNLFGDLCARWASSVLKQEEQRRPLLTKIIDSFGELAGLYLTAVSPKDWESQLDTFYERHGAAAPRIAQGFGRDYWHIETHDDFASYREVRDRCRNEFGITHVERLVTIDDDGQKRILNDSLLRESLRNLDPDHQLERPLALVVLPETDHNSAFDTAAMKKGFHTLAEHYKLFFVEVKTLEELNHSIERFGLLHGLNEDGEPARKLDFLLLCGHGAKQKIHLSTEISRQLLDDKDSLSHLHQYMTADDTDSFKKWDHYLEQQALIGLISCRVACGGPQENNIATALHESLPDRAIDASRQASAFDRFVCDEDGFVSALTYASTDEMNILRFRAKQPQHILLNTVEERYEWHVSES